MRVCDDEKEGRVGAYDLLESVRQLATNNWSKLLVLFHSLYVAKMVIYPDKLTFSRLD